MKKIILGMTLLATVGMFTSCDDFLNEEPKLKQSNELTYATLEGLDAAGAALYGMMQSASWYDGQFILQSELRAGNAKNPQSEPGSGRYRQDTQWNYTENGTSSCWSYAYYTIARANNVINNIDKTDLQGATKQAANNVKAEALFMRALSHLDLVITYAQPFSYEPDGLGVPVDTVTVNGEPARNTVREVYAQIESDLLLAESLMADNYTRAGVDDNAAVASKQAIQALLSRVYLYMEQWQKSADYATKVINSGKYSLVGADAYKAMWSAAVAPKGGEIIFEVYGSSKNDYWDESGWTHLPYILDRGNDGSADVCATKDLVSLYEEGDVRASLYELSNGDYFVLKYKGKESAVPRQVNVPVLRLAEMYLNRAEAISNGATVSGVSARADLQAIASKRGATVPEKFNIFDERRKELAFEGHIVYDYARCKKSLTRTDFDDVKNKDVAFPSYMWAMPIPKREMEANANMVQNPGY
jgi:hypothetical protein